MAKRKIVTTEELDTEREPEYQAEPEPEMTQAEAELTAFLESVAGNANKIKIYKVVDGKRAYCGSAEPSTVSEDNILKQWGGGDYVLFPTMDGRYVKGGTRPITIYERAENPFKFQEKAGENPNPELAVLRDSLAQQSQLMQTLLIEIVKTNNQKPAGPTITEIMQIVASLNGMQAKQPGIGELLDLFKTGIELGKDTLTDGKPDWGNVVLKGLDKIGPAIGALAMSRASQGAGAPASEAAKGETGMMMQMMLRKVIDKLKKMMRSGRTVPDVVDWIMGNMEMDPDTFAPYVQPFMETDFQFFLQIDPELCAEPLHSWFRSLYTELRKELSHENTDAAGGPAGSDTDAAGNEAPDPAGDS